MSCRWHIDECTAFRVAGWIDDDGPVESLDIGVNGRRVATVFPNEYRTDLEGAGIGDGRRSFAFALSPHLSERVNFVTVSREGQMLHGAEILLPERLNRDHARPARRQLDPDAPLLAEPARRIRREMPARQACDFYHVSDLPDGTVTAGQWDLRQTADQYLGGVEFAGKRVIEIGPASGFLSFHMEKLGARVAAIEPPMESFWDLVPQAAVDPTELRRDFSAHIQQIRNSFWFLHHTYKSRVESYEVDAYRIPSQAGEFEIGVLASVLLHVSSPVKMIESLSRVVSDQLIIVERYFQDLAGTPVCRLVPSAANRSLETWWEFSPEFFDQFLRVLGFRQIKVIRHWQFFATIKETWEFFTIVGTR
jgi:hypothetical protein